MPYRPKWLRIFSEPLHSKYEVRRRRQSRNPVRQSLRMITLPTQTLGTTHYRAELMHGVNELAGDTNSEKTHIWNRISIWYSLSSGVQWRSNAMDSAPDHIVWPYIENESHLRNIQSGTHTTHEEIPSIKEHGTRYRINWLKKNVF